MKTLAECAIALLSIQDIWDSGVLSAALPEGQIEQLSAKITLDNLYKEGFLNLDLDMDLFATAVSRCVPLLLWVYIDSVDNTEYHYITHPPFGYNENPFDKTEKWGSEFKNIREMALLFFLRDLVNFVESPGTVYSTSTLDYVWSQARNPVDPNKPLWKLLIIYNVNISPNERDPKLVPSHASYFRTLDELLLHLFNEMSLSGQISMMTYCNDFSNDLLQDKYKKAFNAIKTALNVSDRELERRWNELDEGEIFIERDFNLSLKEFKRGARLYVMGEYLYIVSRLEGDENAGTYYLSYPKEDGLLILTSFYLSDDWEYNREKIYWMESVQKVLSKLL